VSIVELPAGRGWETIDEIIAEAHRPSRENLTPDPVLQPRPMPKPTTPNPDQPMRKSGSWPQLVLYRRLVLI
jgi:hypothetical protein